MAFDPETVDSYELGWKGALFDKRLRMAVALFRANYKDVQVPGSAGGVTAGGVPTFVGITTNAGKARFQGLEVEANWAVAEDLGDPGRPAEPRRIARLSRCQVSRVPDRREPRRKWPVR